MPAMWFERPGRIAACMAGHDISALPEQGALVDPFEQGKTCTVTQTVAGFGGRAAVGVEAEAAQGRGAAIPGPERPLGPRHIQKCKHHRLVVAHEAHHFTDALLFKCHQLSQNSGTVGSTVNVVAKKDQWQLGRLSLQLCKQGLQKIQPSVDVTNGNKWPIRRNRCDKTGFARVKAVDESTKTGHCITIKRFAPTGKG